MRSMRFPWTNIILLLLLIAQVVTGYFGFTENRESFRWILWLHGIGAYGIVVLLYWKGQIIWDALRRKNRWTWARVSFLVMVGLLLVTLVLGLLWTFAGPIYVGGFSLVSLHIYAAVPLIALMVWHAWQMRFVTRLRQTWGRRLFLDTAVSATLGLIGWRTFAWVTNQFDLPGAARRFTGSYERGSFSRAFPVVSWINDRPAPIDLESWRLDITGAVKQPLSLTYDQLHGYPQTEVTATLDCTGGWYATQHWRGVPLAHLLDQASPTDEAQSITVRSVTGYHRRFTLAQARRYLLALAVAGEPLSHGHGFPLRLVAPDQRGVEWVKWIVAIQVNETGAWWQLPLPLQ